MSALGAFRFVLHSHLPYSRMAVHWPHREEWIHAAAKETDSPLLRALSRLVGGGYTTAFISTPIVAHALEHDMGLTLSVVARKRYEGDNDDLGDEDFDDEDFEDEDLEDEDFDDEDFDDEDFDDEDFDDEDFDDEDFDDEDFEDAYRVRQPDRRWAQIDVLVNDPRKMRMAKYN